MNLTPEQVYSAAPIIMAAVPVVFGVRFIVRYWQDSARFPGRILTWQLLPSSSRTCTQHGSSRFRLPA